MQDILYNEIPAYIPKCQLLLSSLSCTFRNSIKGLIVHKVLISTTTFDDIMLMRSMHLRLGIVYKIETYDDASTCLLHWIKDSIVSLSMSCVGIPYKEVRYPNLNELFFDTCGNPINLESNNPGKVNVYGGYKGMHPMLELKAPNIKKLTLCNVRLGVIDAPLLEVMEWTDTYTSIKVEDLKTRCPFIKSFKFMYKNDMWDGWDAPYIKWSEEFPQTNQT